MPKTKTEKKEWSGMPTSNADLKKIKTAIDSTHEIFVALEQEKGNLTDIFNELHEEFGIPRRIFNNLAKFAYFGNADVAFGKNEELKEAWDTLEKVE